MTPEQRDRAAVAAIAALFCIPGESVRVEDRAAQPINRMEQWVSRATLTAIGDAIAAAVLIEEGATR